MIVINNLSLYEWSLTFTIKTVYSSNTRLTYVITEVKDIVTKETVQYDRINDIETLFNTIKLNLQ